MRLTIASKLWWGFGILLLLFIAAGLFIERSIRQIDEKLQEITTIEEPTSAAAYEMEINVIGTGLGVLKVTSQ